MFYLCAINRRRSEQLTTTCIFSRLFTYLNCANTTGIKKCMISLLYRCSVLGKATSRVHELRKVGANVRRLLQTAFFRSREMCPRDPRATIKHVVVNTQVRSHSSTSQNTRPQIFTNIQKCTISCPSLINSLYLYLTPKMYVKF